MGAREGPRDSLPGPGEGGVEGAGRWAGGAETQQDFQMLMMSRGKGGKERSGSLKPRQLQNEAKEEKTGRQDPTSRICWEQWPQAIRQDE